MGDTQGTSARRVQLGEPYEQQQQQHPQRRASARLVRTAYVYDDGSVVYTDARGDGVDDTHGGGSGVVLGEDADVYARGATSNAKDGGSSSFASPTRVPSLLSLDQAQQLHSKSAHVKHMQPHHNHQHQQQDDEVQQQTTKPQPRLGDPAPLALMAFGSTTMLFCSHVAGTSPMNTVTIAQLIFYGGLTQLICGILELINRNTFGGMAFCTYGAFWLHLAGGELLPRGGALAASTLGYEGGHAVVWFVVSLAFLCSSLKSPLVTIAVFATLTLFFVIFAIGNFADSASTRKAAGYEGMVCGALAMYLSFSLLLRDAYDGRAFLPIFHHRGWRITAL